MKKIGYGFLVLLCLALWLPVVSHLGLLPLGNSAARVPQEAALGEALTVYVDNQPLGADKAPLVLRGEAFVAARPLAEALGMSIAWDGASQELTMENEETELIMKVGSTVGYVNGHTLSLTGGPMMVDGAAYVSARAVVDALGCTIKYDKDKHEIHISTKPSWKAYTKKAVQAIQDVASPDSVPSDEDAAVAEILAQAETLAPEIALNIGTLSERKITSQLLKSGKFSSIHWVSSSGLNGVTLTLTPTYKMGHEVVYAIRSGDAERITPEARAVYDGVRKLAPQIVKEDMTNYEKVKAVHDYLVLNAAYDTEAAALPAPTDEGAPLHESYTSYGLLTKGLGVCQAYSEAFDIFMKELGIEANELSGTAGGTPHSWNRVMLDEQWYHIDVTWDDPQPDKAGEISYAYFGLTDGEMAKDHTWERDAIACEGTAYNYFEKNNLVVQNQDDFERIMKAAYAEGKAYGEMRLSGITEEDLSFRFLGRLTKNDSFTIGKGSSSDVIKVYY